MIVKQMEKLGEQGLLAKSTRAVGFLEKMASEEASIYSRFAAKAMAQTVENVIQSAPSALVGTALSDQTWEKGNPLANILKGAGESVLHGAAMGMAFHVGFEAVGALRALTWAPRPTCVFRRNWPASVMRRTSANTSPCTRRRRAPTSTW